MIKIERPPEVPAALISGESGDKVRRARERALEYFDSSPEQRVDKELEGWTVPFHDDGEFWRDLEGDLMPALESVFHNKCAFCETEFPNPESDRATLEHFRPRIGAKQKEPDLAGDGGPKSVDEAAPPDSPDPDWKRKLIRDERDFYYWWLAFDWENLYPACWECRVYEGVFPVIGGERLAHPRTSAAQVRSEEKALLLDPCHDDPTGHLRFSENGEVVGRLVGDPTEREQFGKENRGQVTIDLRRLNRAELADRRKAEVAPFRRLWEVLLEALQSGKTKDIEGAAAGVRQATRETEPFAGMKLDLLGQWMQREGRGGGLDQKRLALLEASSVGQEIVAVWRNFEKLAPADVNQLIKSLHIRDFRSIGRLDLDFGDGRTADDGVFHAPWKVLLGENGIGKSSVLKALALALMGERRATALLNKMSVPAEDFLRRRRAKDGGGSLDQASVKVEFGDGGACEFTLDREGVHFTAGKEGVTWTVVRGYGATRLLPGKKHVLSDRGRRYQQVDNLFDVHRPLVNAKRWLARNWETTKIPIARVLSDLLELDATSLEVVERELREPEVWLQQDGRRVRIEELSAGFQTLLALAVDILAGIPGHLEDPRKARGFVLLDEIGSHLHPRWRQRVVHKLRKAFSGIQFVATTHEPLCLIGLREKEVAVLKPGEGADVTVVDDLPSPEGLRADQLLTSPLFGLETTIDPALDDKFRLYYALLARAADLSDAEKKTCESLEEELAGYGILGYTRRDQMLYRVIDEFLAENPHADPQSLTEETKDRLRRIWKRVDLEVPR